MACCGLSTARRSLLAVSILLLVVTLVILTAGIIMLSGPGTYRPFLNDLRVSLDQSAIDIGAVNLDESNLDIAFITRPLGIAFLIFSAMFGMMSVVGMVAACKASTTLLIVYIAMFGALLFGQVVVAICAYMDRDPFDSTVKDMLKDSLKDYTGIDGEGATTLGWNAIMSYKSCCGVDDYSDFFVSSNWAHTINGVAVAGNIRTPFICCIIKSGAPNCARLANFQTQTYYSTGCYEAIWDIGASEFSLTIYMLLILSALQFLSLLLSVAVLCDVKTSKPTQVTAFHPY